MLTLRTAPASPFGRKVKIAAAVCGLMDRINVENADTMDPNDTMRQQNPLAKIPILILEDGMAIYDSAVIIDWLDAEAGGGRIIPHSGKDRFRVLTLHALASGVTDALLLQVYEYRYRPENIAHQPWLDHQAEKVTAGFTVLNAEPPKTDFHHPNVGDIALACALGYRDFRFSDEWRNQFPKLADWHAAFVDAVPSYSETHPE